MEGSRGGGFRGEETKSPLSEIGLDSTAICTGLRGWMLCNSHMASAPWHSDKKTLRFERCMSYLSKLITIVNKKADNFN